MMRYTLFAFLVAVCINPVIGQTKIIAALKKEYQSAQNPNQKLMALFALCEQKNSLNTDSLYKYACLAKEISLVQNDTKNMALGEFYLATSYVKKGALDTAQKIIEANILKLKNNKEYDDALIKLNLLKAQIFIRSNQYKEGIAEIYKILQWAEKHNDTLMQMISKNGIGWANMEMDQKYEALKWLSMALKTTSRIDYHEKNCNIYSNIAAVYNQLQQYDSAEIYINKSIYFSRKIENLFYLANSLNILANIYIDTKRPQLAEALFNEAVSIRKEIGDPFYIVSDLAALADFYAKTSQPSKGITVALQAIDIANKYNLTAKLSLLYEALGENYKVAGKYKDYSKILEKIKSLSDLIYAQNSAEAIADLDARYTLQKKETLINIQKLEIKNKNILIYGSSFLLLFTIIATWQFLKGYRKSQQLKLLKMQAKEKQLSVSAVKYAQEEERKRISRDLHDNIGAYTTVLMANTELLKEQTYTADIQTSAAIVFENAQNIMESIKETVWILNNDVITITDFIDRFKWYAKKMLKPFSEIQITFKEQLEEDPQMSPAEVLHIFRIMQEAMQNALKHAQPKNIFISVRSKETIEIFITNDGDGFDNSNAPQGNGLLNMQHRAKEAGYHLSISSTETGTEVMLKKMIQLLNIN